MLTDATCPLCYEPMRDGECVGCGFSECVEPEPFTDDDLALLHVSETSGALCATH